MLLFAIFGGIILLLFLLIFAPTDIGVDYLYESKLQRLRIRLRVLGISFSIKVPLEKKEKKTEQESSKQKKQLTPKNFIAFSKSLYHTYLEIEDECKALILEIKEQFACRELYFVIRYGTVNPARTGILNGAVWTAGSLLLKVLDSVLGIEKKTLEVYPDFNRAFMCLHAKATLRFKAFDAAKTVLKIIKLVNLIKSKINLPQTDDRNLKKDGVL